MQKVIIAFDIDGTLRCNCTNDCEDANDDIVHLARTLNKYFKNVKLIAWSGGGKDYAYRFVRKFKLDDIIKQNDCYDKHSNIHNQLVHIAIDDQHDFKGGLHQLIVRAK